MKEITRFLDESASEYDSTIIKGWERLYQLKRRKLYEKLQPWFRGPSALELGCADGEMTSWLVSDFKHVTVVDGSSQFLNEVKERLKGSTVNFVLSLFEEYAPKTLFNTIVMAHILEHLENPVDLLRRARDWLAPGGCALVAVPNANSLHRRMGVKLGMLQTVDDFNDQDRLLGHLRVYTPESLRSHVLEAGWDEVHFGGNMVKMLSNRQMEATWTSEQLEACFAMGDDLPELCSEVYLVLTHPQSE